MNEEINHKVNASITHVMYQCLSIEDGEKLLSHIVEFSRSNSGPRPNVHGVPVSLSKRLLKMQSETPMKKCICCGSVIDCFAIGVPIERLNNDINNPDSQANSMMLLPMIGGRMTTCDHILPIKLGGRDNVQNMQIACQFCNVNKGHSLSKNDLLIVAERATEIVDTKKLIVAAQQAVKRVKTCEKHIKQHSNVKCSSKKMKTMKQQLDIAKEELQVIRDVIKSIHAGGVSLIPAREQQLEQSFNANRALVFDEVK